MAATSKMLLICNYLFLNRIFGICPLRTCQSTPSLYEETPSDQPWTIPRTALGTNSAPIAFQQETHVSTPLVKSVKVRISDYKQLKSFAYL